MNIQYLPPATAIEWDNDLNRKILKSVFLYECAYFLYKGCHLTNVEVIYRTEKIFFIQFSFYGDNLENLVEEKEKYLVEIDHHRFTEVYKDLWLTGTNLKKGVREWRKAKKRDKTHNRMICKASYSEFKPEFLKDDRVLSLSLAKTGGVL